MHNASRLPKKTTLDLLGTGNRPRKQIFDLLDKMRREDER